MEGFFHLNFDKPLKPIFQIKKEHADCNLSFICNVVNLNSFSRSQRRMHGQLQVNVHKTQLSIWVET